MSRFWVKVGAGVLMALIGLLLLGVVEASAQGAENCAPRAVVVEQLAEVYGETRQSIGLAQDGVIVEIFASSETGSWTIAATTAGGVTCLIAVGQSFERFSEALPPAGDPL
ncbi:hypothetical protein QO034_06470 [Sedimentitalea sp. JM2-8]|uniref:Transmembrane protein n=1 Tax=Sedimentitalea xiamensis TaxID=3050037 RepID=A0ABT7FCB1_9RHOB|nr:hypothetical protein [Sedimentitalea xiamensis]MDK3072748.1 hypothetical protein [Sedimentitalea xiamensis]